jgi:hypothetical protein
MRWNATSSLGFRLHIRDARMACGFSARHPRELVFTGQRRSCEYSCARVYVFVSPERLGHYSRTGEFSNREYQSYLSFFTSLRQSFPKGFVSLRLMGYERATGVQIRTTPPNSRQRWSVQLHHHNHNHNTTHTRQQVQPMKLVHLNTVVVVLVAAVMSEGAASAGVATPHLRRAQASTRVTTSSTSSTSSSTTNDADDTNIQYAACGPCQQEFPLLFAYGGSNCVPACNDAMSQYDPHLMGTSNHPWRFSRSNRWSLSLQPSYHPHAFHPSAFQCNYLCQAILHPYTPVGPIEACEFAAFCPPPTPHDDSRM